MRYREFGPAAEVADLVVCTWEREVPRDALARNRILPDGCVDLVWRSGRLLVAGPDLAPTTSPVHGETITGLRLRPGAAGRVLGLPASELVGLRVSLAEIWDLSGLDERLASAPSPAARRTELERALGARRPEFGSPDPLIDAATAHLGRPGARIGKLSEELGTSDRHLRRRFRDAVGYGPKALDRVLRFQGFLALAPALSRGENGLARAAAELGYADQAHLTRECRRLAELTPLELVSATAVGRWPAHA